MRLKAMSSVEAGARELLISTEQNRTNGVLVAVRDSGPVSPVGGTATDMFFDQQQFEYLILNHHYARTDTSCIM
jgi:hypothetical protein